MATIFVQVTETGFSQVQRTLTMADADMDAFVAAYNANASASLSTPGNPVTATRDQTLNYYFQKFIVDSIKAKVRTFQTTPPVVPPEIVITG